ncbi:hypothetical protein TIFTF001_021609 [Ficus carica]|uniref:Uncharacterized protein n=1 Tax=Ficus carica TaxID=3494 RepID=A0AA88DDS9_FICCA|nr:hypothetical protein TIFTF001_021609 [Ficus carica]
MWRAALTETIATACLLFSLTCSIISCLDSLEAEPKLLVPFAVFIIAFLFLMVTVPLTGGHMNPIFTFISALKGVITLSRALVYVLAQCVGSLMGFLVIKTVMDKNAAERFFLGGCSIAGHGGSAGLEPSTALVLEFACTFVVLFVGVTVALDERRCKELGLVMVCVIVAGSMGLAVFVSITVTGRAGYAGVGLNPARCLGPALLVGGELWDGHWVFWVGPFLACSLYYGISVNLPKEGLSLVDGGEYEYDIVKLTGACFGGRKNFPNLQRQN